MYHPTALFIAGKWCDGSESRTSDVINPALGEVIGHVPHASPVDLQLAVDASIKAFDEWKNVPAFQRAKILRKAAMLMRERAPVIARLITLEQGKPMPEAEGEMLSTPEHIDWCADEASRLYGRVVPSRQPNTRHAVIREPIGPVAAFTPWNFPVGQLVRKVAGALAAGCSIIVKAPEETPASCMRRFAASQMQAFPTGP